MKNTSITIGTLVIVSILALAAVAFAHGGYGRHMGRNGGYGMGYGGCGGPALDGPGYDCQGRGMGYGPGYGRDQKGGDWNGLSQEDAAALKAARERFRSETRELRDTIEQKQLDLRKEMVNDTIDTAKATSIQKELSRLKSEFEQKAFAHRLEMRQLLPQDADGREYGRSGHGRGYGRHCQ